jgi:hypothetical protein
VQESFSRLRVGESSGRIKPSKTSKEAQEVCAVDSEKALQVASQAVEYRGKTTW